jgi:hypothetical protein
VPETGIGLLEQINKDFSDKEQKVAALLEAATFAVRALYLPAM